MSGRRGRNSTSFGILNSMTSTTIKVSTETRDGLRAYADQHGETLGEGLDRLLRLADDVRQTEMLRCAMARMTPEQRRDYERERDEWLDADLS